VIALLSWLIALVLILAGSPVFLAIGSTALVLALIIWPGSVLLIGYSAWGTAANWALAAIPLFILMGEVILISGLSDDAFSALSKWLNWLPGGLACSTVAACTAFASVTGSSPACTAAVGVVTFPQMRERNYDKGIAIGSIGAGGALGVLIPPSIAFILFGMMTGESIGKLFFGGIIPGLVLASLFIGYIIVRVAKNKSLAPPPPKPSWQERFSSLRGVWAIFALAFAMLGSIYFGIATPTEAASVGAFGSIVICTMRGKLNWPKLRDALLGTAQVTCMVLWILIAAMSFGHVLSYSGLFEVIIGFVTGLAINRWVIMIGINVGLLAAGCILEIGSMIMLLTPLLYPLALALGFDGVWFGVIFVMNCEMAYLTPPVGINLYVLRGIVPEEIKTSDIFRAVAPFVSLQALGLAIVMMFPQLALFIPSTMRG